MYCDSFTYLINVLIKSDVAQYEQTSDVVWNKNKNTNVVLYINNTLLFTCPSANSFSSLSWLIAASPMYRDT